MSEKMYAYVCDDRDRGDELVCAIIDPSLGPMPLVSTHMALAKHMRPIAEAHARASGKPVKLVVFSKREILEILR